jgi:PHD/YefM family antitoxin component YafN of YafNO toxin-antitoxin module
MIQLDPQLISRSGKPEFVVLPYAQFKALQEHLEDMEDLRLLQEARARDNGSPGLSIDQVRRRLKLKSQGKAKKRKSA